MSLEVIIPGFPLGSTVRLKSDNRQAPKLMTVQSVSDGGWVCCVWFLDDNKIECREFRPESLILVYPTMNPGLLTE